MKKYLTISAVFAGVGLLAGVYYREFTKYLGFANQYSVLGGAHVHFLVLGFLTVILFGLLNEKLGVQSKFGKLGLIIYIIGVAGAGALMIARGTCDLLERSYSRTVVSAGLNGALSGIAGIFHVTLAAAFVLIFISWFKALKRKN